MSPTLAFAALPFVIALVCMPCHRTDAVTTAANTPAVTQAIAAAHAPALSARA